MQHRRLLSLLIPLLALAACGEDQPPTAPASPDGPDHSSAAVVRVVNSVADPGDGTCNNAQCTLREAINDPLSTEITFASGVAGPITLAPPSAGGGMLQIQKTVTITGPSAGIVIRRRATDPAFRIMRVDEGVTVKLANLTIRGGKTEKSGAGIVNWGTLELINCTVAGNSAAEGAGGIANYAKFTLRHSTVADNIGGGIGNYTNGTLVLKQSTVTHNSYGIGNTGGVIALTRSMVSENSGVGIGSFRGRLTLTEARIVANTGSGISTNRAVVALTNSTVARNSAPYSGGGISVFDGGNVTIANSTVAGNSATNDGGGIYMNIGRGAGILVTLTNSTVSGNSAGYGGGIYNSSNEEFSVDATVVLTNSTVALNSATSKGGGLYNINTEIGYTHLTNTLVAQNTAPTGPDVLGTLFKARFSLIGDGTGGNITNTDGNLVGNVSPNSSPIDPKIGPLALNGGPTRTHALLLGSPAIDAASTPDCPATDQRGVLRPQGAACDIGSFERE
jgi:CSLREA domain-containing protein